MFASLAILIILLSLPLSLFETFQPQTTQDALTSITADDPCVTPEPDESTPPKDNSGGNDSDGGNTGTQPNDGQSGGNNDDSGGGNNGQDTNSPDDNGNQDGGGKTPKATKTPKVTKTPKAKTPKNLAKKIQKKVQKNLKGKKPTITVTIPTPRPPLIRIPTFPAGFPFNNKKAPTPTIKVRPTSPVKLKVGKNPLDPAKPTKAAKKTKVPNAKDIQNTVKKKLKNGKVKVQADNPCSQPRTITISVKDKRGGPIPSAGVLLNSSEDGVCKTDSSGSCSIIVYHSGKFTVYASKLGFLPNELTTTVENDNISTTITLYKEGTVAPTTAPKQDPAPTNAKTPQTPPNSTPKPTPAATATPLKAGASKASITVNVYDSRDVNFKIDGAEVNFVCDSKSGNCDVNCYTNTAGECKANFLPPATTDIAIYKDGYSVGEVSAFSVSEITNYFVPISLTKINTGAPGTGPSASVINYNTLLDCFSDKAKAKNCNKKKKKQADLNGDGKVNQKDYNIFLKQIQL